MEFEELRWYDSSHILPPWPSRKPPTGCWPDLRASKALDNLLGRPDISRPILLPLRLVKTRLRGRCRRLGRLTATLHRLKMSVHLTQYLTEAIPSLGLPQLLHQRDEFIHCSSLQQPTHVVGYVFDLRRLRPIRLSTQLGQRLIQQVTNLLGLKGRLRRSRRLPMQGLQQVRITRVLHPRRIVETWTTARPISMHRLTLSVISRTLQAILEGLLKKPYAPWTL